MTSSLHSTRDHRKTTAERVRRWRAKTKAQAGVTRPRYIADADYAQMIAAIVGMTFDPLDAANNAKLAIGEHANLWPAAIAPDDNEIVFQFKRDGARFLIRYTVTGRGVGRMVSVDSPWGKKTTQAGGSPPAVVARMLAYELAEANSLQKSGALSLEEIEIEMPDGTVRRG